MKQTNNYPKYESCIKACLRCADACNHCASSCTQEKDIKMMARCIQLDMECATICYASAQLMSLGSEWQKLFVKYVQIFAGNAMKNAVNIKPIIARNVQEFVKCVRKNVRKWQLK